MRPDTGKEPRQARFHAPCESRLAHPDRVPDPSGSETRPGRASARIERRIAEPFRVYPPRPNCSIPAASSIDSLPVRHTRPADDDYAAVDMPREEHRPPAVRLCRLAIARIGGRVKSPSGEFQTLFGQVDRPARLRPTAALRRRQRRQLTQRPPHHAPLDPMLRVGTVFVPLCRPVDVSRRKWFPAVPCRVKRAHSRPANRSGPIRTSSLPAARPASSLPQRDSLTLFLAVFRLGNLSLPKESATPSASASTATPAPTAVRPDREKSLYQRRH